ncbi:MAG: glycoside hydrolase family 5 protein [Hyphomonadaceae bacterium]|nr:glycoside hydrolase family 5 protein [Hyphomonadaceae bacterium]
MSAASLLAACAPAARGQAASAFPIRRGVNLGNALDAPNEGDWGYRIEAAHLHAIASAGFDGVRLPVRWDTHMDERGRVSAAHMARVAEVIGWAMDANLKLQLDVHHYETLIADPRGHTPRLLALWRQIAERFADAPASLLFEPLNEPNGRQWDGARLTDLQSAVITTIRQSNATRTIVLGPGNWQNIDALERWRPPAAENIAVSVHYYEPHDFTHQGAEWLGAEAPRFGRDWGSEADLRLVQTHIERAASWGARQGYAVQVGEFGVNRAVALPQRALWTHAVRQACEAHGLGWCVWDFAGAFPVFDLWRLEFIPELRDALFL